MSETTEMTDEQIQARLEELTRERERRQEAAAKEEEKAALAAQINALLLRYRLLCVDGDSTEWVQPVSAVDAYPRGAVRTHKGQEWESTVVANVWEPGVSGWRLTPERDESGTEIPSAFVRPTGAHDAYLTGELITWEDGHVYAAARDGVVHTPEEHPDSWARVGGDPEEPGEGDGDEEPPDDPDEDGDEPPQEFPEFVQPTGLHDAYAAGDVVAFEGQVFQSKISGNVWSPTDHRAGWELREDEFEVGS